MQTNCSVLVLASGNVAAQVVKSTTNSVIALNKITKKNVTVL